RILIASSGWLAASAFSACRAFSSASVGNEDRAAGFAGVGACWPTAAVVRQAATIAAVATPIVFFNRTSRFISFRLSQVTQYRRTVCEPPVVLVNEDVRLLHGTFDRFFSEVHPLLRPRKAAHLLEKLP